MMHLSRIQINPARRQGQRLLASPQAMHAAVLASFPQDGDERGRVLWRVDRDETKRWLYVVSQPAPDFAHIVEQAGWQTTHDTWAVRPYAQLLGRLETGQRWGFRLTANPTRSTTSHGPVRSRHDELQPHAAGSDRPRSKRYGHVTVEQQCSWLLERAERWGFAVDERDGVPDLVVRERRVERFQRKARTVTVAKATFDGVLTVTDVAAFREVLVSGVGPAKAYGCGLLTVAPLP